VPPQRLGPVARQRDLADRGGSLAVLELERTRRKPEYSAAERDGARGNHQEIASLAMQRGEIGGERGKPGFVEPARLGIDQEGGADLDDDAAEIGKPRRVHGRLRLQLGFLFEFGPVLRQ